MPTTPDSCNDTLTAPRFTPSENVAPNTGTQLAGIRRHLEAGKTITSLEALKAFSCFRLAARIDELKNAGMLIDSRPVAAINAEGKKVRISEYRLAGAAL